MVIIEKRSSEIGFYRLTADANDFLDKIYLHRQQEEIFSPKSDYIKILNKSDNVQLNLFDKDKTTKLFTWKKDYSLTKNVFGSQKGIIGGVEKVLNIAEGIYPNKSPFQKDLTNADLIENTGKAVLAIRDSNLSRNLYKSKFEKTSFNFFSIDQRDNKNYKFFDSNYNKFFTDNDISNKNMAFSYELINSREDEYGNQDYQTFILGTSKYLFKEYINVSIQNNRDSGISTKDFDNPFQSDNSRNSWLFNNRDLNLHWDYNSPNDSKSIFGNYGGLIEYTRNLMISSKGKYVSNSKKIFDHDDKTLGFNGSGIFEAPSTALPEFKDRRGVRQHTFKDPYNNFSKAIRFVGNRGYNEKGGNENSVIYETVLPRMHPIAGSTVADNNKRLMFSIENLAFEVIAEEGKKGIIINSGSKDEIIPISEVGAFGGRVMWFPPYDLNIVETANAKFSSTVFLGRNEPIYNYENSEREATITFKLIADYPPNLHDFQGKTSKEIVEFFAFGGTTKENIKNDIVNKTPPEEPIVVPVSNDYLTLYFPNDKPLTPFEVDDMVNRIIDIKYGLDGNDFSVNSGMLKSEYFDDSGYIDAYNYDGLDDKLNSLLSDENLDIKIDLIGHSTALYINPTTESQYNTNLSQRRCDSAKKFIEARIKILGLKNVSFDKIRPLGSRGAPDSTIYPKQNTGESIDDFNIRKQAVINSQDSISWRNVEIIIKKFKKNNNIIENTKKVEPVLETTSVETINIYEKTFLKERSTTDVSITTEGIDSNYESIKDNYFMPVFHSQTPEDYHRRLTFLQQCTRQGAAQRTEQGGNNIRNSVFGRQPICILRIGDFMYTKIIINSINFSYKDAMWDLNPEGFGLQPLMCDVTMNIKIIGGQSLKGPIDLLQNAISFNYYANSTFTNKGIYKIPKQAEDKQYEKKQLKQLNNANTRL